MELKGTVHYDRLNFKKKYDMPIEDDVVFQDITDYIMDNRLGKEFFNLLDIVENKDDGWDSTDSNDILHFVEEEIDEFEVTLGEHFPDTTFTIDEANDIHYNVEDVDEDLVDLCLTHVISNTREIASFDFSSYYLVEASNDSQLGEYYLEEIGGVEELSREQLESYFDYEAYGRDIRISGNAIDCDGVYLMGGR